MKFALQAPLAWSALRWKGKVPLKRPAAGGESCKQDSILYNLYSRVAEMRKSRCFLWAYAFYVSERMDDFL